jgi:hypothetical protein
VLTGKYDLDPRAGRAAGELDQPRYGPAVATGRELTVLARQIGRDPAHLAMAFAPLSPSVTAVLFGATRPEQIWSNLTVLSVARGADRRRARQASRHRRGHLLPEPPPGYAVTTPGRLVRAKHRTHKPRGARWLVMGCHVWMARAASR